MNIHSPQKTFSSESESEYKSIKPSTLCSINSVLLKTIQHYPYKNKNQGGKIQESILQGLKDKTRDEKIKILSQNIQLYIDAIVTSQRAIMNSVLAAKKCQILDEILVQIKN